MFRIRAQGREESGQVRGGGQEPRGAEGPPQEDGRRQAEVQAQKVQDQEIGRIVNNKMHYVNASFLPTRYEKIYPFMKSYDKRSF